jgi:hypothetical protein
MGGMGSPMGMGMGGSKPAAAPAGNGPDPFAGLGKF